MPIYHLCEDTFINLLYQEVAQSLRSGISKEEIADRLQRKGLSEKEAEAMINTSQLIKKAVFREKILPLLFLGGLIVLFSVMTLNLQCACSPIILITTILWKESRHLIKKYKRSIVKIAHSASLGLINLSVVISFGGKSWFAVFFANSLVIVLYAFITEYKKISFYNRLRKETKVYLRTQIRRA